MDFNMAMDNIVGKMVQYIVDILKKDKEMDKENILIPKTQALHVGYGRMEY